MQSKSLTRILTLLIVTGLLAACAQDEPAVSETEATATEMTEQTELTELTEAATQVPAVEIEKGPVDLDALLAEGKPIMLQFGQEGCPACDQMLPSVVLLQEERADDVIIRYVDVRDNMDLLTHYQVQFTPTQIFIDETGAYFTPESVGNFETFTTDDGTEVPRHVGFMTEDQLRSILEEMTGR